MKIIVEGCDGSGKTTLIKKIQETLSPMKFEVMHFTTKTDNSFRGFFSHLNMPGNYIYDRFHLGQMVYQTEGERVSKGWMSDDEYEKLDEYISNREDIVCLYVEADSEVCLYNCHHNGEDGHYTEEYINELKKKYSDVISRSKADWIIYKNNFCPLGLQKEKLKGSDFSNLPKILAVDFDGCLVSNKYPEIGELNRGLAKELMFGGYMHWKKILWTSRTGAMLDEAINFCKTNHIYFDAINTNIDEVKRITGDDTRKVYADLYLDDKSLMTRYHD